MDLFRQNLSVRHVMPDGISPRMAYCSTRLLLFEGWRVRGGRSPICHAYVQWLEAWLAQNACSLEHAQCAEERTLCS